MDLENKYLTYSEYKALGGTISNVSFKILEYRAENKINLYTMNRFQNITEYPTELKMCVFDLLNLVDEDGSIISSESVGNYSITRKDRGSINDDIRDTIKNYLSNVKVDDVPVLYIGAD